MPKNILVLLAGCGAKDGAEIQVNYEDIDLT